MRKVIKLLDYLMIVVWQGGGGDEMMVLRRRNSSFCIFLTLYKILGILGF